MKLSRIFLLFFISVLAACQSASDDQKQTAEMTATTTKGKKVKVESFFVRYLASDKETSSQVSFLVGDSIQVAKSIPMVEVKIQDRAMRLQNLGERGIRYSYRGSMPYSTGYNFQYQYEDGNAHSHQLGMTPINDFLIKEGQISKQRGATLVWKGDALKSNQSLVIMFTDENQVAVYEKVEGPTDIPEITLTPDQLSKLNLGKSQLYLVKKQFDKVEKDNRTIISEMEYYTETISLQILD